jgi:hypothetical protein
MKEYRYNKFKVDKKLSTMSVETFFDDMAGANPLLSIDEEATAEALKNEEKTNNVPSSVDLDKDTRDISLVETAKINHNKPEHLKPDPSIT